MTMIPILAIGAKKTFYFSPFFQLPHCGLDGNGLPNSSTLKATLVDDVKKKKLTTREDLGFAAGGMNGRVCHINPGGQNRGPVCGEVSSAKPAKQVASEKADIFFGEISKVSSNMEDDIKMI